MSLKDLSKFKQAPKQAKASFKEGEWPVEVKPLKVSPDTTLQIKFLDEGDSDGFFWKNFHVYRENNRWGSMDTKFRLCLSDQPYGDVDECVHCAKLEEQVADLPDGTTEEWKEKNKARREANGRLQNMLFTNVLVKDAPVWQKVGDEFKIVGSADKVQVYRASKQIAEGLAKDYEKYGAIKNQWYDLEREGATQNDTVYTLTPSMDGRAVKEPEENTAAQQTLVDRHYIDLPRYFKEDSLGEQISQVRFQEKSEETAAKTEKVIAANPLKRAKKA